MLKARPGKEVVVRVQNEIGLLAQIARLVSDKGINIVAAAGWVEGPNAVVHLVTSDNLRVMDALRAKSYHPREQDVILTESPHKPGLLRHITDKLSAAGIDIHHLYATATGQQEYALIVFACAQNDRALVLLNE
jgi:hypothetical protein